MDADTSITMDADELDNAVCTPVAKKTPDPLKAVEDAVPIA